MTAAENNAKFVRAARTQGMLTEPIAAEVLKAAGESDVAATLVLQRGLMDARQVDMIQTLVSGSEAIPGYTIIDIIGHGGMGVVFRARQETLDREVALKTILVGGRVDEAIQRFRNEATSVARLNHPNIVTAFDSGQHEGRIYYSMELVDGQNLTDYVEHRRNLSATEALAITRQAALGLAHAWEHRIVHRDIKPDNLLMTAPSEFDQSRTVKITDLGLAHLNSDTDAARITQTGAAIGSPLYMPPEQLNGSEVDCRSDIYSLGSTLFFMLSGRAPFDGESVSAVLYNKASGNSVPLTDVADVDDRVVKLVNWMMASAPDDRPQDYRAVVSAIDDISGSSSSGIPAPDLAATQNVGPYAASPRDATLHNTSVAGTDTSPGPGVFTTPAGRRRWLLSACVSAVLLAGISLVWFSRTPATTGPIMIERLDTGTSWASPLFDGQSLDGWDRPTAGTPWEVTTDPVEQAFALSGNTRKDQTGSIRRRIPELIAAEAPWFEVETNVLLQSAEAAGIQFGMTDAFPGFRLQITEQQITLLGPADDILASQPPPVSPSEYPLHVRVRLQPNGWLVEVNDEAIGSAPPQNGLLPEILLFIESGQAFFSGINAAGLQLASEQL